MSENQIPTAAPNVRVFPDGRMDARGAAEYLGLSAQTLANMRSNGTGPEFVRVGNKRVFYFRENLDRFVRSGRCKSGSQFGRKRQQIGGES